MKYAPEFHRPEFKSSVADMKNNPGRNRMNAQASCAAQFIGDPAAGFYVLKFGGSEVDNATYADVNWYNGCCLVGHVDSPTGLVPHFFGDDHASGVIEHIILHLALDKLTSLKLNSNSWGYGGSRNVDDNLNPVG